METKTASTEVSAKQVWVDTGNRVVKLNISRVLPSIVDDDERDIMKLLKSLITFSTGDPPAIMATGYILDADPRQWSAGLTRAKADEVNILFKRKEFKIVHRYEVPHDAKIVRGRFVLAIKNVGSSDESCKARFVVQGHTVQSKGMIVHVSVSIKQQTICTIVDVSAIPRYILWSQDVSQAFPKSSS